MSPLFASVRQVCTVVDDFETTVRNVVDHLGVGPFRCWHFRPPVLHATTFRGQPAKWTMKLGITWLDDMQWEIIQPVDGASLYREHLTARGRGVQHLLMGTGAVPFERAAADLAAKGHPFGQTAALNPPLLLGRFALPALPRRLAAPANLRFGYIDAESTLRTSIELTRYPLGFSERFALRAGKPEFCIPAGDASFERPLPNLWLRRVAKVGIVTRDLDATVRSWIDVAGIAPWHLFEVKPQDLAHLAVAKTQAMFRARVGWAFVGDVLLEVVQPMGGASPHKDVLESRGECVAYLGVEPKGRFEELVDHFRALGYPSPMTGAIIGTHRSAYFGARGWLGTDLEVISTGGESLRSIFERLKPGQVVGP